MQTIVCALGGLSVACVASASTFYGKASGSVTALPQTISWYADEACTSTEGVVAPSAAQAVNHAYAILGSSKVDSSSSFPAVTAYLGTDGATVGSAVATAPSVNMNAGITLTFPNLTVFSGYFQANSGGQSTSMTTTFAGNYTFVKTSQSITFGNINIPESLIGRSNLAGSFSSDSDAVVCLTGISGAKTVAESCFGLSGDFSGFKGSFKLLEMTYANQYCRGTKILRVLLDSPSALGDASAPRTDALVLCPDSHLTLSANVTQSDTRGITVSSTAAGNVYLNAEANASWTLTAPLYGSTGTLVKEGAGRVTLNGSLEPTVWIVSAGTLVLGPSVSLPSGFTVTVKAGAKLLSQRGFDGVTVTAEEGAEVAEAAFALPTYDANYDRWVLPTTAQNADGAWLWTDHRAARGGVDYTIDTGMYVVSGNNGWHDEMVFPGKSLTLANGSRYVTRALTNVISNFVLGAGTRVQSAGCAWGEVPHRMLGRYTIAGTSGSPVLFVGKYSSTTKAADTHQTTYDIVGQLLGSGYLQFGGQSCTDFIISSTNADFTGTIILGCGTQENFPVAIRFAHPQSLGGSLPAFAPSSVQLLGARCGLKPTSSLTFDTPNRGIEFAEEAGFIETPAGVTMTVMNPVRLRKGLEKRGAGTLAFGGSFSFGSSGTDAPNGTRNRLTVREGFVKAVNTNSYEQLALTFADGAGIAAEAHPTETDVATYGLCSSTAGRFTAEGALYVRLDDAEDELASGRPIRVNVCTVSAETADLTPVLKGIKPAAHYGSAVTRETLADGRVRYSLTFARKGFAVIVR